MSQIDGRIYVGNLAPGACPAANDNSSPDMGAVPAQHDAKPICANLVIRLAHVAKNSSLPNHSKSDFVRPPVFLVIPSAPSSAFSDLPKCAIVA